MHQKVAHERVTLPLLELMAAWEALGVSIASISIDKGSRQNMLDALAPMLLAYEVDTKGMKTKLLGIEIKVAHG